MDTLQVAGMISKELKRSGVVDKAPQLASNIAKHFHEEGLTVCDLKPLADVLHCEPEMSEVERKTHQGVVLVEALRKKLDDIRERVGCDKGEYLLGRIDDLVNRLTPPSAAWYCAQVAQALNWERTEFDTLDELLEELRRHQERHAACLTALEYYADTNIYSSGDVPGHVYVLDDNGSTAQVCLMNHGGQPAGRIKRSGFANRGSRTHNCRCVLNPVATSHTLLHAGELYREVTILLHTEQLVAWRTADGQEYSAKAHQVLIDPDEDGLAAAILSRIAGVEIAPEHMAELRAQMAGGSR